MKDKIHRMTCPKCEAYAYGPDLEAVKASMARHEVKAHPKAAKK